MVCVIRYRDEYLRDLYKLYCSAHNIALSYDKNIIEDIILKKIKRNRIKLLSVDNRIKGYILFSIPPSETFKERIKIDDLYIDKYYSTYRNYKLLLDSINHRLFFRSYKYAQLNVDEKNKMLNSVVSNLDFILERKMLEMKIILDNLPRIISVPDISFSFFRIGMDEEKRMETQNSIFGESKWHRDCTIEDILYEEQQDYFIEDGCIFINYKNNIVGYSQIILDKSKNMCPCIVNFGIIKAYRGNGFGKLLLNYTLNIIKSKGYSEAFITVDSGNYKAYNLYKKTGFIKINSHNIYIYRYK